MFCLSLVHVRQGSPTWGSRNQLTTATVSDEFECLCLRISVIQTFSLSQKRPPNALISLMITNVEYCVFTMLTVLKKKKKSVYSIAKYVVALCNTFLQYNTYRDTFCIAKSISQNSYQYTPLILTIYSLATMS